MKHAYLIMAHNEFDVLQRLVTALDDVRNDIFIHVDRKVKVLPQLLVKHSNLYMIHDRIDVRWGHISQVKAEYVLMEDANKTAAYHYFHILSGVHFPLKSQDYLHNYFAELSDWSVLNKMSMTTEEVTGKLRYYGFFIKHFMSAQPIKKRIAQFLWAAGIKLQKILGISRNKEISFIKSSNWVSLTREAVNHLIQKKPLLLKQYRYTLCSDEFFVATELNDSPLASKLLFSDYLLKADIGRTRPKVYTLKDYPELKDSPYLFARKFDKSSMSLIDKILEDQQH